MLNELVRGQRKAVDHVGLIKQAQLLTCLPVKHEEARITPYEAFRHPCLAAAIPHDLDH
ncbi:hypothetical protein D3C81_1859310 [compost metagenome]